MKEELELTALVGPPQSVVDATKESDCGLRDLRHTSDDGVHTVEPGFGPLENGARRESWPWKQWRMEGRTLSTVTLCVPSRVGSVSPSVLALAMGSRAVSSASGFVFKRTPRWPCSWGADSAVPAGAGASDPRTGSAVGEVTMESVAE